MNNRAKMWLSACCVGCVVIASGFAQAQQPQESVPGQRTEAEMELEAGVPGQTDAAAVEMQPSISETTLTYRSHSIAGGASAGNLEGNVCPASYTMVSGACHPGYNDRVIIINQFPNRFANTWRCGFRNQNSTSRTVWIYTLCAR
jgi:hypothetical protein